MCTQWVLTLEKTAGCTHVTGFCLDVLTECEKLRRVVVVWVVACCGGVVACCGTCPHVGGRLVSPGDSTPSVLPSSEG